MAEYTKILKKQMETNEKLDDITRTYALFVNLEMYLRRNREKCKTTGSDFGTAQHFFTSALFLWYPI